MIKKDDVKGLAKSFVYAYRGICYCIKNERNMRIHLSAAALISYFAYFFQLNRVEYMILLLCFGFVIAAEAFNTSIEALVNLESPAYHNFARIAKDVAAAAVAIAAFAAVLVGIFLFGDPARLWQTLLRICSNPLSGLFFAALLVLAVLFIFQGPKLFGPRSNRNKTPHSPPKDS